MYRLIKIIEDRRPFVPAAYDRELSNIRDWLNDPQRESHVGVVGERPWAKAADVPGVKLQIARLGSRGGWLLFPEIVIKRKICVKNYRAKKRFCGRLCRERRGAPRPRAVSSSGASSRRYLRPDRRRTSKFFLCKDERKRVCQYQMWTPSSSSDWPVF